MHDPLLDIRDLCVSFRSGDAFCDVVTNVNLAINPGEAVALVGESGSGKTVTALSIAALLPTNAATKVQGRIYFNGKDLLQISKSEMQGIRGGRISYIFQEPGAALNPVFTVGYQIDEVLSLHNQAADMAAKIDELLRDVGIDDTKRIAASYPHQLSGGQQQRVMIAMALACEPDLLIADEPTTALDVTVQAQILDLLKEIKKKRNMSILIITHNLAIAASLAQRMYVMYAGQIVETGDSRDMIRSPYHPYSNALLRAVPKLRGKRAGLDGIAGSAPTGGAWPVGCRFHPRCSLAKPVCSHSAVGMEEVTDNRYSRCLYWKEVSSS